MKLKLAEFEKVLRLFVFFFLVFFFFLRFPVSVPRLNGRAGEDEEDGAQAEVDAGRQVEHDRPG